MWRPISELRKTDRDYSGIHYPYDYAKKHKNPDDVYSSICSDRDTRSVGVTIIPLAIFSFMVDDRTYVWYNVYIEH